MGCASSCATVVPRAEAPQSRTTAAAATAATLMVESKTRQPMAKPHNAATASFDPLEQAEEHSPVSFRTLSDDRDLTGHAVACASPLPRRRPNALLTFRVRGPPRTPRGEKVLTTHPPFAYRAASVARLPIVAPSPEPWATEPRPLPRTHRVSPLLP
eukprot:EG_transcript_39828